jgi:hypothetical protein
MCTSPLTLPVQVVGFFFDISIIVADSPMWSLVVEKRILLNRSSFAIFGEGIVEARGYNHREAEDYWRRSYNWSAALRISTKLGPS